MSQNMSQSKRKSFKYKSCKFFLCLFKMKIIKTDLKCILEAPLMSIMKRCSLLKIRNEFSLDIPDKLRPHFRRKDQRTDV